MPTSAWCDECKTWVWVGPDGCCATAGHPAAVLRGHYEAEMPDGAVIELPDQFGVGELPSAVDAFNWGAFIMLPLWSLVHGTWQLVLMWVGVLVTPLIASFALGLIVGALRLSWGGWAMVATALLGEAIVLAARLYAALNGGRLTWENDARRIAAGKRRPRSSVSKYLVGQRTWVKVAIAVAVVSTPISSYATYVQWDTGFGMGLTGAALSGGAFLVEILIGYIVYRMRKEA